MIKVIVGTNTDKTQDIVDASSTPREVLEKNDIDYATGSMHLDGATMKPGDLDKTFEELGIKDKCYLISVVKSDSGK